MATLGGLRKAGWSFKAIARLAGKSDSYVRQAFGGNNRKDRTVSDELRQQTYRDLTNIIHDKTGNTPPSKLHRPGILSPVYEVTTYLRGVGHREALQVGVKFNANKEPIPPLRRVTATQLGKLIVEAIGRFGQDDTWVIAVYGTRHVTEAYDSFGALGIKTGWWTARVPGAIVAGMPHPAYQHAIDLTQSLNYRMSNLPTGISPEVDARNRRELQHDKSHYVEAWAEAINGLHWDKVFAVWIGSAHTYL